MMLSHEKLDVYQRGIEFLILATDALNQIPSGHGEIKKQLRKASLSILLNIAEASGKTSDADRQNFYAIGRGSAHECAALLDALAAINAIDKQDFHHGKDLLHDLISMLTKMARPD